MEPSSRSFRDDLELKLADIETMLRSAHLDPERREGAVKRLARLLGASAQAHGLIEVSRAADELERADAHALPAAADRLLIMLRRVVADPTLRRTCVLVVSADPERRRAWQAKLMRLEREVLGASPFDVERLLAAKTVAVVVIDATSEQAEAEGLLERLRARPRAALLPVVVLCAAEGQAAWYVRGADTCITPPHDFEVVRSAVDGGVRRTGALLRACRKDPLTGLLNREGVTEAFMRLSAFAARTGEPLSLALIEVDESGMLDDAHGKAVAEEALRHLGSILTTVLRRDDQVGSWEDDRFVALLPVAVAGAVNALTKALKAARRQPLEVKRASMVLQVGFSAGIVDATPHAAIDEVVADAERRLWMARAAGARGIHAETSEPRVRPRVLVALQEGERVAEVVHRLAREGFDVVREVDGAAALKAARTGQIAVCVVEARLPVRDGFQVLERIRNGPVANRLPVLLVTAGGRDGDVARGFEMGADDHIATPFSVTDLVARVRRLLRRRPTARLEADSAGGVVGAFIGDQLIEFVQMLGISAKTGVVRVTHDTFSGALYFEQGKLVGASTSIGSSAAQAALEVILTPQGRFAFEPGLPLGVRRDITVPVDVLLMDALRRRDEARRRAEA